jgi:hypothetical protein
MKRFQVSRPSPAMVVAVIALIVALGGSAYAAHKIGSKNLKKNAVTTKKIKDGAVTSGKLANGAVTGAKLAKGAVGVVMRQGAPVTITSGSATHLDANCRPGERATGGGVFNESQVGTLVLTSSYPLPNPLSPPPTGDGQTPTGWRVWLKNNTPGSDYTVNAYVICIA